MLEAYLAYGHEVDMFHFRFPHEEELPASITRSLHGYTSLRLDGNRHRSHVALLPPLAWQSLHAYMKQRIDAAAYDIVQAETSGTWAVARVFAARKRLLVMHDDDSARMRGLAKFAPDLVHRAAAELAARKYSRWQRVSLIEADRVWFVSSVELERLAGDLWQDKARLIPNGAGDELWSVLPSSEGAGQEILFVAPGFYDANTSGLAWFLRHAWPLLRERVPGAHLRVVGVGWEGFGSHPGVSFVGWRRSLAEEYSNSRVVVAPLFAGGGTKLKVVEAMAAGRPVVASPVAVEGFAPADGLRVSDDPQGFAEEIHRFLADSDLARQAGESNRCAVEGLRWSMVWDAALRDLELLHGEAAIRGGTGN